MKQVIGFILLSLFICFLDFGFLTFSSQAQDPSYVWPIEKMKVLSSTFGEHRNFRFHSGIDIPTQGRTGYKVFACQSGYVYRLFTSWRGYGKAIYLRLHDGRFVVYGHLSDFSKKIQKSVIRQQLETKRYHTDFLLKENKIQVNKGEIIGYSGESGWGGPHLHFELRDSSGHPMNPLTSGFSVEDKLPPLMRYLAVRPLAVESRVDGSIEPVILPLAFDPQENVYILQSTPTIEGEIGLELSIYDKMETSPFDLGIYGLELYLDDSLVFSSRYDRIFFENTHKIELDRDFELREKQKGSFYKLYVEEGNDLPIYDPIEGRLNTKTLEPGPHEVMIKAFDARDNFSTLAFSLVFDKRALAFSCSLEEENDSQRIKIQLDDPNDAVQEIIWEKSDLNRISWEEMDRMNIDRSRAEHIFMLPQVSNETYLLRVSLKDNLGFLSEKRHFVVNADRLKRSENGDSLSMEVEYSYRDNFFVFNLEFDQILRKHPYLLLKSGGFNFDPLFMEQEDERSYRATFPFFLKDKKEMIFIINAVDLYGETIELKRTIPIAIITKSYGGIGVSSDGKAKVEFDPDALYNDINVAIHQLEMKSDPIHKQVGKIYSFEPSTIPFNGWARISLEYPPGECDPNRLGLYELSNEGSWNFIDQKLDTLNQRVEGKVRSLSVYSLLEDTLPPMVSKVSISAGMKIKARNPKITAVVKDDLSGIGGDEDVRIEIDREWMIPEYDPERMVLSTCPLSPLNMGKHLLTIWVKDRAGNETQIRRDFFVVGN